LSSSGASLNPNTHPTDRHPAPTLPMARWMNFGSSAFQVLLTSTSPTPQHNAPQAQALGRLPTPSAPALLPLCKCRLISVGLKPNPLTSHNTSHTPPVRQPSGPDILSLPGACAPIPHHHASNAGTLERLPTPWAQPRLACYKINEILVTTSPPKKIKNKK
jgi:hypothetical protein